MFARTTRTTLAVLLLGSAAVSVPSLIAVAQDNGPPAAAQQAPADDPLAGINIPGVTDQEDDDDPLAGINIPGVTDPAPAGDPGQAAVAAAPAAAPNTVVAALAPDLVRPSDPVEAAAFDALMRNCARCHQDGMLIGRLKPNKNFGNILNLAEIAREPRLIAPGNPDGSEIIKMMLKPEMPYDVYGGEFNPDATPPTEDEIAAIRTWITSLGAQVAAACGERDFIGEPEMVAAMASDIETLPDTRVADTRYITLTNLYNACATDEEMNVYRQAVVKLLNSLSRVSDVVRLETVDEAGTIVRFNLKDLGWTSEDWDTVLTAYPYAIKPDTRAFDLVSGQTLTILPFIRGDWFAFAAAQPPLYDKLLKLADNFAGFEQQLGLNTLENINNFVVKRAGFQQSGVSQNNRLIERHQISTGYFWTSYDFGGNRERQSLFEFPLGPGDGEFAFHHDGGETIFSLPNGFQGYYLNRSNGERLDKGPTNIVRDLSRRDLTVTNGISCMGCHDQGIRMARDDIREHILANRTFPRAAREAVEALYPPAEEMDAILNQDRSRFLEAMARAGLGNRDANGNLIRDENGNPTFPKLNGVEMIGALAQKYENDVDLRLAAADFGLSQDDFLSALDSAALAEAVRVRRRLEQGLIPRDNFEPIFMQLVEHVTDDEVLDMSNLVQTVGQTAVAQVTHAEDDFDLSLTSNADAYRVGDLPIFTITTQKDCFLTLINVDGAGKATVLYPNAFEQQNHITAGKDFQFPSPDAPYQFRFADHGEEAVIAVCSLENKPVDDIAHNFTQAAFTDIGDYEEHVREVARTRQIIVQAANAQAAPVVPVSQGRPEELHGGPVIPAPAQAIVANNPNSRAAIKIQVE